MARKPTRSAGGDADGGSLAEVVAAAIGLLVLAVCMACPWACWAWWGPWVGLAGVVGSQVLYLVLLAPWGGICLGLPWLLVALNGVLALAAIGVASLVRWMA